MRQFTPLLGLTCLMLGADVQAQDGIIDLKEIRHLEIRRQIQIPDVNGLKVLKCDFHMHTVFTDGYVWPTIRVKEAWKEGLDSFAFTEHLEYTPFKDDVKVNPSRPHEMTAASAAEHNLILVKGVEITRKTPPGHFNALFVGDLSGYVTDLNSDLDQLSIDKAVEQNAFIFWNHPGWQAKRQPDSYAWLPFIEKQYQDKKLHGVEVANGFEIYTKSIDWALDRNLTIMANTDVHRVVSHEYDLDHVQGHRTMTLVFAKERTEASIREALHAGNTVAWAGKYLIGKEENVRNLVQACVSLKPAYLTKKNRSGAEVKHYELVNNSDLYFELSLKEGSGTQSVILLPRSTQMITAAQGQEALGYEVQNSLIRSDKSLVVSFPLQ